jgi:hypothetical protein
MAPSRSFIIDFAGEHLPSCLLDAGVAPRPNLARLALPLRVAVRGGAGGLRILAGEGARGPEPDAGALVFHNLLEDLPAMEDEEVQGDLLEPFWSSVVSAAGRRYRTVLGADTTAYVVYPHGYPAGLLGAARAACARSEEVRRVVFVHEALALILGLFYSRGSGGALPLGGGTQPVTACAVVARAEQQVEVACFDYLSPAGTAGRLVIRDYFRTTCRGLPQRLDGCEWLGEISLLCRAEAPALGGPAREALAQALRGVDGLAVQTAPPPSTLPWLKCLGAAYVAGCNAAGGRQLPPYDVVNSLHVGVRLDQRRFYPVLRKEESARAAALPGPAAKSFRLSGEPGRGMELSLHAGYSDLVAESVALGSLSIDAHDLSLLAGGRGGELFAAVHLNSPGGGELTLGLMPDDRVIGTLPFVLPGLVC